MTWCRSEAESNKASSGASVRERHGLEQELATAKACEAALSHQVQCTTQLQLPYRKRRAVYVDSPVRISPPCCGWAVPMPDRQRLCSPGPA